MSLHYRKVLDALDARKGAGGLWYARCPAHSPDRRPSLVLREGSGCLLAVCNACGAPWAEIVRASGTEPRDWFAVDPDNEDRRRRRNPVSRRTACTYPYVDEEGYTLYECVRFEPKDFSQRRPMPEGGHAWTLSGGTFRKRLGGDWSLLPADAEPKPGDVELPPCRRVLYRLPGLLADLRQPVLVCEGEKDADLACALGLVGTTSVCGAQAWSDDYGIWLEGRRVVIVPDADSAGAKYAGAVLLSCVRHHATSVRLLDLPEPAKDLSDWFDLVTADVRDSSRTGALKLAREALIALIRDTPEMRLGFGARSRR